jgi:hypothetical protein
MRSPIFGGCASFFTLLTATTQPISPPKLPLGDEGQW